MKKLLSLIRARPRPLLVGLFGVAMFLAWFGLWVRVLPVKPRASIPAPERTEVLGVSNKGKQVVTLTRPEKEDAPPYNGPIRVWDTQTHAVMAEFLGQEHESVNIRISPDARFIIVNQAGEKDRVHVFDTHKTGELGVSLKPYIGLASRFSPNSRLYAHERYRQFPESNTLEVWDLVAEQLKWELVGLNRPEFSPDSSRLATIQLDSDRNAGAVVVFDVETGTEVQRFPIGGETAEGGRVVDFYRRVLLFSLDGNRLAVDETTALQRGGPPVILVFDVRSGQLLQRHEYEPELAIHYLKFLPDGSLLIRGWRKSDFSVSDPEGGWFFSRQTRQFLMLPDLRSGEPKSWFDSLKQTLGGNVDESSPTWILFRLDNAKPLCRITDPHVKLSDDETVAAWIGPGGDIQIWDLPPRPPVEFCILYAALPALLFTGLLWWRLR